MSSGRGSTQSSSPSGSRAGTDGSGSSAGGAGSSTSATGSDAEPTTTAPSGRRSTGTGSSGTGSSGTGSSGEYGAGEETGSASASASEEPPTTTSAAPSSRSRAGEKTGKDGEDTRKDTGKDTGASFSLAGGLDGFKSTPWNNQGATDPSAAASPNVPGRTAVKFEMPGGGKRTEAEPDIPDFTQGEKAFVGYSGFFDQGFPTDTDTWQLIMQFKQPGTGSPPLAVEVGKGQLRLANNGRNQKDFCPVTAGAFSFQMSITFGGAIDAWCNGKQTLSGYRTPEPNLARGSAYLKTGIYRDPAITQDSTLFLNDLKIGRTLESVSGLAGAGTGSTATAATTDPATTDSTDAGTADRTTAAADPAVPTQSAPAAAAPASTAGALGDGTDGGSTGTGSSSGTSNSYFTTGPGGASPPGPRPPPPAGP